MSLPLPLLVAALVLSAVVPATALLLLLRAGRRSAHGAAERVTELETLNEIGRVLLTDRNLRGVLRLVADSAARLSGADTAHVALLAGEDKERRLVVEAATGALAPLVGSVVPTQGSMDWWVVERRESLVVNDAERDSRGFRALHERMSLRQAVALPLLLKGSAVGALGVENRRDGRAFRESEVEVLRNLAGRTALVVESIRAVDALSSREQRAELINALNSRIRQSLELGATLHAAVRELGTTLGVSRCLVRLREGGELLPAAHEWLAPNTTAAQWANDPSLPLVQRALEERTVVHTSDALGEATSAVGQRLSRVGAGALAVLAAPIVLRGEAIGVIVFQHRGTQRQWTEDEIELVETLANELAVAIYNARLFRSAEEASRELAVKIEELERANLLKAQFLANMSHELRTPLNSVIGFSEMVLAGALGTLGEAQRDALETISRNGRHLLQLVNDVLDLSKIEAGKMEINLVATDLRALVADVLNGIESLVRSKGHHVTTDFDTAALVILADEMRVRQVLFNLLSNAVKFTPASGQIAVRALRRRAVLPAGRDQRLERDAVWVAVSDNGIGISQEQMPLLFSEFTQLDASFSRQHEGTGLGLALSKRLVDLHGGLVTVESVVGRGSTFWVALPVEGPLAPYVPPVSPPPSPPPSPYPAAESAPARASRSAARP